MTDSKAPELKPCPFCGGEAEIERYTIKPYVACMKCGCSMPDRHQTAEQAIEAWNARAEQAIAATLGSGTLTADDVLNAVYKHGARWQAIADELNAELGSEREKALEELVRDMARVILLCKIPSVEVDETACRCMDRMAELGIEMKP